MTRDPALVIDKRRARATFDRAAAHYDEHDAIQRLVADRLDDALDVIRIRPRRILDLGAATGYCAGLLERRYPGVECILFDLSPGMLAVARSKGRRWRSKRRYVAGDAESLPLATGCVDVVFSNLALPWCNDPDRVLAECRRVLRVDGLLIFSSFGPDTLCELRRAWRAVDDSPRVNQFIDMHDVGDAVVRAGFASPVLSCDALTATYPDVYAVMRDLRGIGAVNSLRGRRRGLSTARELRHMAQAYDAYRVDERLPATYEIVYAHAWVAAPGARPQDGSTVATFPLNQLGRRR